MQKTRRVTPFLGAIGALAVLAAAAAPVLAKDPYPSSKVSPAGVAYKKALESTTQRIVVRYKPSQAALSVKALSAKADKQLKVLRASGKQQVLELPAPVSLSDAKALAAKIAASPEVLSAEPDLRVKVSTAPNDPYFSSQWPLSADTATNKGASKFSAAWERSTGAGVVVAVVDTGQTYHPDMEDKELPGYDFISDPAVAGDDDGRDANPSDEGDFCAEAETPSSWHGLSVASLIAAVKGNGLGITGAAPDAKIVHARSLGRCGGYLSDTADAVAWAAGEAVPGVPANPNPAKVINLSLGTSPGAACPAFMQTAINAALAKGAVVIAATGNDGAGAISTPANCAGVVAVAANTQSGDTASYSNLGAGVSLSAPGGGSCMAGYTGSCVSTPPQALSNSGPSLPGAPIDSAYFAGTSSATPHVSAAAALLLSARPDLPVSAVRLALTSTTRPFDEGTFCAANPGACGTGMLDAAAAVESVAALGADLGRSYEAPAVVPGATVSLTATARNLTAGETVQSYAWTQTSGDPVVIAGADTATIEFQAPTTRQTLAFKVDITTNLATTSATTNVIVNNLPTVATTAFVGKQGEQLQVQLEANDPDGETPYFELVSAPQGLVLTQEGLLTFTPVAGGTLKAVVRVIDGFDLTPQEVELTFEVEALPPAPVSNSGGGGGGAWGLLGGALMALAFGLKAVAGKKKD